MWNLLRKITRKKPKMENIEEIDMEVLEKELSPFSYKWTKGDNNGIVCEYDNIFKDPTTGVIWVNFKDGTRINYSLLNDYMIQIDPILVQNTINTLLAPTNTPNSTKSMGARNVMIVDNTPSVTVSANPITSLLEKQKPNWVEVGIKLKLNLPTKSLYNILTSSFEDADTEIIEFVVNDLDIEIIKDSLRQNIREIYKANHANIRKSGNDLPSED
jgi:hypothetical protein